jgi:CRISPR/Cas system-associated exonuclease Cas4 (RecB family)
VAEDVAQVEPELAIFNANGEIESVRYSAVNAMLLNEFLKEHRKVQELEAAVAKQRKDFEAAMTKLEKNIATQLQKQAAEIEKVHTQVEIKRSAPKLAAKNR